MKSLFLDELIDRASKNAGSDAKLAQRLMTSRQAVSDWRKGKKTCPAADQAIMASIAGLDAEAFAARALIAQHEGTEKGELLKSVLKKALVATGAALATFGASASEMIQLQDAIVLGADRLYTMYIVLKKKLLMMQFRLENSISR